MRMRKFAVMLPVLLFAAWLPHDRTAPNRWALIVGISDYMNFEDEIGGDLPGAAWDARRMRDVLIARWGFEPDRIRMVLDHDATRARIERELTEWLPAVAKPGDAVIFFFAGHGSQTWDLDGDEEDGLDETICPTDVMKGDASRDIRDDELNSWLTRIPTKVVVILDNCHAGTGTRAVTPFARPRSLARDVSTDLERPAQPAARSGLTAAAPSARNVLEIAAAQADEVAVDAEWPGSGGAPSTHGGAFTTTLVRQLWRAPRRTSYEALFHLTAEEMKRQRFAQQPLLTTTGVESQPFAHTEGGAESEEAFVPVLRVSGSTVELGGGAGAGITAGSVYRAGAATLRVTAVQADRATAEITSGGAPRAGARAQLSAYSLPQATLIVSLADVDESTRAAIRSNAAAGAAIRFTASPRDFAHLIVRPAERGYVVIGMDGALRHQLEGDRAAAARATSEALHREAGAHQLAALENPGQAAPLDFGFESGRSSFRLGENVRFRVRVPKDGYLTIIDIGTDGRIAILYPTEAGDDGAVRSGATVSLPDDQHYFQTQEPAGRGIVRAFLTDAPMKLSFAGDDAAAEAANVLRALRTAAGAAAAGGAAIPTGSWMTASVVYTIDR